MKYHELSIRTFFIVTVLIFGSCSPVQRLNCLLENHPYLFERIKTDTIIVDRGKVLDTFFISQNETDTFYINSGIRIERYRDTIRLQFRERNCTTYIQKTEIQPTTKIIETKIRNQIKKERKEEMYKIGLQIALILLLIGLFRYLSSDKK